MMAQGYAPGMSTFKIIDFYNSGAQVTIPAASVDMTHSFGATAGAVGEETQIGYEPKGNAKLADGAAYDELVHEGQRYLLLKGGHVYDVTVGGEAHVISAEAGHQALPIPAGVEVDVAEHDNNEVAEGQPESTEDEA